MKLNFNKSGFSLIEILVVIVILGVLGTVATQSLFSLLRGAAKTEVVKEVKQNGDYALSVMEVKLRNSTITDSDCTAAVSGATSLTLTDPGFPAFSFRCVVDGSTNRISQFISGQDQYLTNTSVTLPTCMTTDISFTCINTAGVKNILIKFTLTQAQAGAQGAESASQVFQTQVTLRNK